MESSLDMVIIHDSACMKLVSDSPGASGFCYWAVNSVLKLPDGQVKFFEEFILQKNCNQSYSLSLHPDDYLKLS